MLKFFNKKKQLTKPNTDEIAVAQVEDKYSTYPSNGLTPFKLANIFKEADSGDVMRQMELFEEMEEKDPHLFSQLQTRKNAVTGLDYEIIPFSDEEKDKEITEFVKREMESLENFEDVCMDLLDAIGKGIAFSEIIWAYDEGRVVIEDITWRPQKKFFWDENDDLKVKTKEFPNGILIPENKFIIHRYKARSGHPSRAGVLRVVAWMYLFKNYDVKDWVAFCEVFGMPLRLGKYSAGASEADKAALMQALIQIGTDAAGIIPEGTEIDFKESSKTTSINVYESLARFCDEQMSKAILGQTLTSDSGGGSYAQSKTHNEVRHDLTVADCKALAATIRNYLIRPLVFFNFGEDKRIPYIRFDCEETEDLQEMSQIFKTLICDIGLKVPTSFLYKKFSIPKPERNEEITQPIEENKMVANKVAKEKDYQGEVDLVVDKLSISSKESFKKLFEPLMGELETNDDLVKLKEKFEDEKYMEELYSQMNEKEIEDLLFKGMFIADIFGRMKEHERSI